LSSNEPNKPQGVNSQLKIISVRKTNSTHNN
jgi:hypothetical protein